MINRLGLVLLALFSSGAFGASNLATHYGFDACGGPWATSCGSGSQAGKLWPNQSANHGSFGQSTRTVRAGPGGVFVTDRSLMTGPNGVRIPANASRFFPASGYGAAFARALLNPWVAAGAIALPLIYDAWRDAGVVAAPDGSLLIDPGQPKVGSTGAQCTVQGGVRGEASNPSAACAAALAKLPKECFHATPLCELSYRVISFNQVSNGAYELRYGIKTRASVNGQVVETESETSGTAWPDVYIEVCPETTLPPLGFSFGGPCPSNNRVAPTPQQWEEAATKIPEPKLAEIAETVSGMKHAVPWARELAEEWVTDDPVKVEFPQGAVTSDTTVTRPDGTQERRITEVTCQYAAESAFCKQTTRTTTPGGETTETGTPQETPVQCDKYPDSLGCMRAGDAPDETVREADKRIDFSPDSRWGAGTGSCPAPRTLTVLGRSVVVDNTLLCDFLGMLRPIIIAAFGLAGALVFVGGLRD